MKTKFWLLFAMLSLLPAYSLLAQQTWYPLSDAQVARWLPHGIVHGDKFYVISGFVHHEVIIPSFEAYDFATDTWSHRKIMPVSKYQNGDTTQAGVTHTATVLVGDSIWVVGGRAGTHPGPVTEEVWIYDIAADTWLPGPDLPLPLSSGYAVNVGRRLHYVGGFFNACNGLQDSYHFTLDIDKWRQSPSTVGWENVRTPLPRPRSHVSVVGIGNKIYVFGGEHGHDWCAAGLVAGVDLKEVDMYDVETDTWTQMPDLPYPRSHSEGMSFAMDGKVYQVGSEVNATISKTTLVFDPQTGLWSEDPNLELPTTIMAPAVRPYRDRMYISHGGYPGRNDPKAFTKYRPMVRNPRYELEFSRDTTDFWVYQGQTASQELFLFAYEGLAQTSVQSSAAWLGVNGPSQVDVTGRYQVLNVNSSGLAAGVYYATLVATATGADVVNPALSVSYIPDTTVIRLTVGPSPDGVVLLNQPNVCEGIEAGTSISFPVEVYTPGNQAVAITGASLSDPLHFTYNSLPASLSALGKDSLWVTFTPDAAGIFQVDLSVLHAGAPSPTIETLTCSAIPPCQIPAGWADTTFNGTALTGSACQTGNTIRMTAAGNNIWSKDDQGHFYYTQVSGDGEMIVKVNWITQQDPDSKIGIMFRQSLASNSPNAYLCINANNSISLTYRTAAGQSTNKAESKGQYPPHWMKLVRSGNTYTAYHSEDSITWIKLVSGANPATFTMSDDLYVGIAFTSHNVTTLAQAELQSLSMNFVPVFDSPSLAVNTDSLVFTAVEGAVSNVQQLVLSNPGDSTLYLGNMTKSGADTAYFQISGSLPDSLVAGASATLNLSFLPDSIRGYQAQLSFVHGGVNPSPLVVKLTGQGLPEPGSMLTFSASSFQFGNVGVLTTSPAQTLRVVNQGPDAVLISGLMISGSNAGEFQANAGLPATIAVGDSLDIPLTFSPNSTGTKTAQLALSHDADNPSPVNFALTGEGGILGGTLSLSPATLIFPTTSQGQLSASQTVTATNSGNQAIDVTSLTIIGSDSLSFFANASLPVSLQPGQNLPISITFLPQHAGSLSAQLAVSHSGLNGPQGSVSLSGSALAPSGNAPVLYRVNAASNGGAVALDAPNMNWAPDNNSTNASPYRNSGSKTGGATVDSVAPTVPAYVPIDIFKSERSDPSALPEMQWDFPIATPGVYEVHLFFMNNYGGTSTVGKRVFDVLMEGAVVLNDYDIVADVGHKIGTMKSIQVNVTDGNLDIDFQRFKQDPLINGIEIVGPIVTGPTMVILSPADGTSVVATDMAVQWVSTGLAPGDQYFVSLDGQAAQTFAQGTNSTLFSGLSLGTHGVKVQVANASGVPYVSSFDSVTFTLLPPPPPSVSFSSPANGSSFLADSLVVTWTETNLESWHHLQIRRNGGTTLPIAQGVQTHTYYGLSYGNHSVVLNLLDSTNQVIAADTVVATRLTAPQPSVDFVSPLAGAVLFGDSIPVSWAATNLQGNDMLLLTLDGGFPVFLNSGQSNYTFHGVAAGAHDLALAVADNSGTPYGNPEAHTNVSFSLQANAPVGVQRSATFSIHEGVNQLINSTYAANSFRIYNDSDAGGLISSVVLDLSTSAMTEMVFDPFGSAGDPVGKNFTVDTDLSTGYQNYQWGALYGNGGYQKITVNFNDFGPGEWFGFSADIDPTSSEGLPQPGPNHSATISGLELMGATVTVTFSTGEVYSTRLFSDGSLAGIRGKVKANPAPALQLAIQGASSPATITTVEEVSQQTLVVTGGTPFATFALFEGEAAFYETAPGAQNQMPFEINAIRNLRRVSSLSLDASGSAVINVMPMKTHAEGGYNYYLVAQHDSILFGAASNPVMIRYNPTGDAQRAFRINGGGNAYVSVSHDIYAQDGYFFPTSSKKTQNQNIIANTTDPTLYNTDRYNDLPFSYELPSGNGLFEVTMLFAETKHDLPGNRKFAVDVEGVNVLFDFDINAAALADPANNTGTGKNYVVSRTFYTQVTDSMLTIQFNKAVPTLGDPKINALVVKPVSSIPAPTLSILSPADSSSQYADSVTVTWQVSSALPSDRVLVSVDGGAAQILNQPVSSVKVNGLAVGTHKVLVKAANSANVPYAGAADSVIVTILPPPSPELSIVSPAEGDTVEGNSVILTWTSSQLIPGDQIRVQADAQAPVTLAGNNTSYAFSGLSFGAHQLTASVVNAAGQPYTSAQASDLVNIVLVAPVVPQPEISLTSPANGASFLNSQLTLTWTSLNLQSGDQIEVMLDGNVASTLASTASSHVLNGLSSGGHTVGVRVVNAASQPYANAEAQDLVSVSMVAPTNAGVLYRVNAAGSQLPSLDAPNSVWSADGNTTSPSPYRNSGSKASGSAWTTISPTVPAWVPTDVFKSERSDPSALPEMQWDFPIATAGTYEVHLFFMNNYGGTSTVGSRVFNVELEGSMVLPNYDIVADAGHKVGTMKAFRVNVTDGNLDLNFFRIKQDPLINGIEIVGPLQLGPQLSLTQPVDGSSSVGTSANVAWNASGLSANDQFLLTVDNQPVITLTQPASSYALTGLAYGSHKVKLQVADSLGNGYASLADSSSFTLLAPPVPSVNISSPADGDSLFGNSLMVQWQAANLGANDQILVSLDGGTAQSLGQASSTSFSGLSFGSHQVLVQVADAGGNAYTDPGTSDLATVVLKAAPGAVIVLTAPAEGDSLTGNSATAQWTTQFLQPGDQILASVDGQAPVALSGSATSYVFSGLTDGNHEIRVRVANASAVPYAHAAAADTVSFHLSIPPSTGTVLYRVDAAGSGATALDPPKPNWSGDGNGGYASPYRNAGSNISSSTFTSVHASVPGTTPLSIFSKYRWDGGTAPDMMWDFPVANGLYEVRLYFLNSAGSTSTPGKRVFDVSMEGAVVWDNMDLIVDFGHQMAGMKSALVTVADGNLDIDFGRVANDPIVSGFEIIQLAAAEGGSQQEQGETTTGNGGGLDFSGYQLLANVPNPFTTETLIRFELPVAEEVELTVYNSIGQEVWHSAGRYGAGLQEVSWRRSTTEGQPVAAGMYTVVMTTGAGFTGRVKMVVQD